MSYKKEEAKIMGLEFDQISVGLERTLSHTITQKDVDTFASLTGDFNPVHVDPEFAKLTSFGKNVVHGMLTSSFVSTMIGMLIPGPGALWTSQQLEFLNPSFVGDTIKVLAKVVQKSEAARTLILEIEIINQKGIKVVSGKSTVKMLELKKKVIERDMKKVTLITGGAKGIGLSVAKKLAQEGHAVVLNYLSSSDEANAAVSEIRSGGGTALAYQGDVSNTEDMTNIQKKAQAELGPITSVVHCASPKPIPEQITTVGWDKFENNFMTQVGGAYNCVKSTLPAMLESSYGSYVFIGSIFTQGTPPTQQSPYVVAKAALEAYARTLAVELGPKGIRVNIVSPGMTHTEMIADIPEKTKLVAKMNTPLRRLADTDDVANAVAFLLSDKAQHITGETLKVCGGLVM